MKKFDERFMRGLIETDASQAKKSALVELKTIKPSYDVFQSQRRGITIRDEERGPDFTKSKS